MRLLPPDRAGFVRAVLTLPLLSRLALALGAALLASGAARAQAPAPLERAADRALDRALSSAVHCQALWHSVGPDQPCTAPPPPTRHAALHRSVIDLAFMPPVPAAAYPRFRGAHAAVWCQLAIAESTRVALREAIASARGIALPPERPDPFDLLAAHCSVTVEALANGGRVPQVGPACAAALGEPGEPVDADALRHCLSTLAGTWAARAVGAPGARRPNIVVVLTDDQRGDAVDATHSPDGLPVMPAVMDRLAAEGVLFRNSFVTNPVCGPSRATAFTGRYTSGHGARANLDWIDEQSTLATWLQGAGYTTGFIGKYTNGYPDGWGGAGEPALVPPGWNDFRAFAAAAEIAYDVFSMIENGALVDYGVAQPAYATDVLADQAVSFIRNAAQTDDPFLLYVATSAPHFPFDPAPRHVDAFLGLAPWEPPSWFEEDVSDKPAWVRLLTPWNFYRGLGFQNNRRRQLEMGLAVDDLVDRVMNELDAHALTDETVVIFTSDNGEAWGEHRWHTKACPWEECLRVPLIIRAPHLAPLPRVDERMAVNIDLAPTIAELAGVAITSPVDGTSLVTALDDTALEWRNEFLVESFSGNVRTYYGLRTEQRMFAQYLSQEIELYDLDADPYQLENLDGQPEHALTAFQMALRAIALQNAIRR